MVNGISSTALQKQQDLKKLAMYATGTELHPSDRTGESAGGVATYLAGKSTYDFAKANDIHLLRKENLNIFKKANRDAIKADWRNIVPNAKKGVETLEAARIAERDLYKSALEGKTGFKGKAAGSFDAMTYSNLNRLESKYTKGVITNRYHGETRRLIEEAKGLHGKELSAKMAEIDKAIAKGKLEAHNARTTGILKPKSTLGKIGAAAKKYSGYDAVAKKSLEFAGKNKVWGKVVAGAGKLPKGTGVTAVIEGALEAPTVIEAYNKLGAGKGTKQLLKSSAKVGASVAGYAAGAQIGGIIGSFIPIPVVGTLLGVGVGIACSWAASKIMSKIVGKDEVQIAKEKQAEELAKKGENDPEIKAAIVQAAKERKEAEKALGIETDDTKELARTISKTEDEVIKELASAGTTSTEETEEVDKTGKSKKVKHDSRFDSEPSSVKIGDYKTTFANLKNLYDFATTNRFLVDITA